MFDIFNVILLNESHCDALAELEEKCFSTPWTAQMFLGDLSSEFTRYFGIFDGDVMVGYAGMWLTGDEAQITNVAVHPDFRKRGIAQALVNELIKVCKYNNFTSITLEVRESNNCAICLYDKLGFEKVGFRKNYYKNPNENALLMTKGLK